MATIFTRLMNYIRGEKTKTQSVTTDVRLTDERAEQGLMLSGIDGDPRTTQALSDELHIKTKLDEPTRRAA